MFNKDTIVSKALKTIASHFIEDYGRLTDFNVDSKNKSVNVTVMLNGELNELNLQLFGYEIYFDQDKAFFSFDSMHSSRQWLNILYQKELKKQKLKFEIPTHIAKPLKMFI